ncbi:unnamed protein product [Amoebophrya sp. A25]|nr:unnamed protein product [Amoebophrya sp. A25]|eukprot:GSA25T00011288001.1
MFFSSTELVVGARPWWEAQVDSTCKRQTATPSKSRQRRSELTRNQKLSADSVVVTTKIKYLLDALFPLISTRRLYN